MTFHSSNLNKKIKFKITEHGEKYLDHLAKTDPVYMACGRPKFDECSEGYSETVLWEFINIFGPKIYMGCDLPVEATFFLEE